GIATDQTGTGTVYTYQWPCCGTHSQPTDFFSVNPAGQFNPRSGNFASRTFGLIQQNNTGKVPDPQWPFLGGANFAVNPINGEELAISSLQGRIFRTNTQGTFPNAWFQIGFVSGDNGATATNTLDGTYAPALAYGAPEPGNPTNRT